MVRTKPQATVRLQKTLSVRRSRGTADLHWWSLPLSVGQFARLFAEDLHNAKALLVPAAALRVDPDALQATVCGDDTLLVADLRRLFELADSGKLGECKMGIFPEATASEQLHTLAPKMSAGLDTLPFLFALDLPRQNTAQVQYAFRKAGDALKTLESLALGRAFGAERSQVEQALLQHEDFATHEPRELRLVLQAGGAKLLGVDAGGCRQVCYLESGRGFAVARESRSRWQVLRSRFRESHRRFPVNVALFAGLPAFIGYFKAHAALRRRRRS